MKERKDQGESIGPQNKTHFSYALSTPRQKKKKKKVQKKQPLRDDPMSLMYMLKRVRKREEMKKMISIVASSLFFYRVSFPPLNRGTGESHYSKISRPFRTVNGMNTKGRQCIIR